MTRRYTHNQFLKDAQLLELPEDGSFTPLNLKRQRGRLMQDHHPDKGGSNESAQQINEAYERLLSWVKDGKPRLNSGKTRWPRRADLSDQPKQGGLHPLAAHTIRATLGLLLLAASGSYTLVRSRATSMRNRTPK